MRLVAFSIIEPLQNKHSSQPFSKYGTISLKD